MSPTSSTPAAPGPLAQVGRFLWARRKWWLGPLVVLVVLVVGLLILGAFTPLGAFIYTIF